ncbi:MAPEG family protein [Kordiimonas aquimaris]|uniref:MAPEG family protein n=1 Tax=Kordiimonas aquimaris TaxID=707591 RepID=UPI0021D2DADC|nr:MAPEG family protein [Kordiimonas aquimaris]
MHIPFLGNSILNPALAMITWTLIMWVWMYATRLPAMSKAKIDPQDAAHPGSLNVLPAGARRVADNYNHLHEQPTIFYALMFYSHIVGVSDNLNILLAWSYVGVRVLHSLLQATVNIVLIRFLLFVASALILVAITARNITFAL